MNCNSAAILLTDDGGCGIERLDYHAQLAQRRYEEVYPAHRLVATRLEQRWNQALEEARRLKDDYHRLGRACAHYGDLVAIERAEAPSHRADPKGLVLL